MAEVLVARRKERWRRWDPDWSIASEEQVEPMKMKGDYPSDRVI